MLTTPRDDGIVRSVDVAGNVVHQMGLKKIDNAVRKDEMDEPLINCVAFVSGLSSPLNCQWLLTFLLF